MSIRYGHTNAYYTNSLVLKGGLLLLLIILISSCGRNRMKELKNHNKLLQQNFNHQQHVLDSMLHSPVLKLDSLYAMKNAGKHAIHDILNQMTANASDSVWKTFALWQLRQQEFDRQIIGKWKCISKPYTSNLRTCDESKEAGIIFYPDDTVQIYGGNCICLPISGEVAAEKDRTAYVRRMVKNVYHTEYYISLNNLEILNYLLIGNCKINFDIRNNKYLILYYNSSCTYNFEKVPD